MICNKKERKLVYKKLNKIKMKSQFVFSFPENIFALFSNASYIVRNDLYKHTAKYARIMQGNVLDFGCGSKPYKELFSHCKKYIGCDIKASGHDHTNEEIDYYYDGENLPFLNESFDWIFSSQVFEHIENLDEILDELHRILVPKGGMIVTMPFVWLEHEIPYDFIRYTSFGIKAILEKHGFEVLELKKASSGIEAISQIMLIYIDGLLQKIAFNKSYIVDFFRAIIFPPLILVTLFLAKIFPRGEKFYLQNIVLCKKY